MRLDTDHPAVRRREDSPRLISHATIGILSCVLVGMGLGTALPQSWGLLNLAAGASGLGLYGLCEQEARRKRRRFAELSKAFVEHRLDRNVCFSPIFPTCARRLRNPADCNRRRGLPEVDDRL